MKQLFTMTYLKTLPSKTWFWLALAILIALGVMVFDFSQLGLYQDKNDTEGYMDVIHYFDGQPKPTEAARLALFNIRLLKPFYGIVCSVLTPLLSAYNAMLLLNIFFYLGTAILLFFILKKFLNVRSELAMVGTTWFACSYPMLRYGFALMTDISGYFFITLTIFLCFKGLTTKRTRWFLLSAVCAGIGSLAKETSALGLLFVTGAILLQWKEYGWRKAILICAEVSVIFLAIFLPIQAYIIHVAHYSYLDFWKFAQYEKNYRTLKYYFGIQAGSFHVLWIYAFFGLMDWYKNKKPIFWIALWFVGLPGVLWTIYVVRYFFVAFVAVIPFSLFGLHYLQTTCFMKRGRIFRGAVLLLPSAVSIILFLSSKGTTFWSLASG